MRELRSIFYVSTFQETQSLGAVAHTNVSNAVGRILFCSTPTRIPVGVVDLTSNPSFNGRACFNDNDQM